jgi:hypothetical protein
VWGRKEDDTKSRFFHSWIGFWIECCLNQRLASL